jgi:hypothetical protein
MFCISRRATYGSFKIESTLAASEASDVQPRGKQSTVSSFSMPNDFETTYLLESVLYHG